MFLLQFAIYFTRSNYFNEKGKVLETHMTEMDSYLLISCISHKILSSISF